MLPSVFLNLDEQEKAFVVASIKVRIDAEKEAQKKAESKRK